VGGRNGLRAAWNVERARVQNDYSLDQTIITPCVCLSACVCDVLYGRLLNPCRYTVVA